MTKHYIAKDYYNSPLSNAEISKKHGVNESIIKKIAESFEMSIGNMPEEDKVVIVINKSDAPKAQYVLRGNEIENYIPDRFELTEYYESKFDE